MPVSVKTRAYFDRSAARYTARSESFLWRWQRRRELSAVASLLGQVDGMEILDLGCGSGFYTRYCLDSGASHVTAVDFSSAMIDHLPNQGVRGIVADAAKVQLDRTFPKIICAGLLEFADDPQMVLANARRFLGERGAMICLVPPDSLAGGLYRKFHQRNNIDITLFSGPAFRRVATGAGWTVDAERAVFPYTSVYRLKA